MSGGGRRSDWALKVSSTITTTASRRPRARCAAASSRAPSGRPADLVRFVVDPAGRDRSRSRPQASRPGRLGDGGHGDRRRRGQEQRICEKPEAAGRGRRRTCPNAVETLFVKRVLEALSLANKAGLLTTGFDKVETLLDGGRAAALLHGSDAASDGRGKLDRKYTAISREKGQPRPIVDWLTIATIELGHRPVKCGTCWPQTGRSHTTVSEGGRALAALPVGLGRILNGLEREDFWSLRRRA